MLNINQQIRIKKALSQLDNFSEKEVKVYCAVLGQDNKSIPMIAKDTRLSRGTVYDVVEKLKEKGYLFEIKKGTKRRIAVLNPTNKLYAVLDDKYDDLEKSKKVVDEILPVIKSLDDNEDFKPQIRIYEGEKGFYQVWDEILCCEEKHWLSIAKLETFIEFCGEDFLHKILKRKTKLRCTSRAIHQDSSYARQFLLSDATANRETKIAPKEFEFPSTEIIFGDKVAMFSTQQENIILVIESRDFAQTHRAYFEMIWKFLESNNERSRYNGRQVV